MPTAVGIPPPTPDGHPANRRWHTRQPPLAYPLPTAIGGPCQQPLAEKKPNLKKERQMNGSEGQNGPRPFRQCLAISVVGKSQTHHRCRLQAGHRGEHQCVVNGCYAGWRS